MQRSGKIGEDVLCSQGTGDIQFSYNLRGRGMRRDKETKGLQSQHQST